MSSGKVLHHFGNDTKHSIRTGRRLDHKIKPDDVARHLGTFIDTIPPKASWTVNQPLVNTYTSSKT